ncbi:unnamed protein product, partial [Phaeothamnion confervicola]
GGGLNPTPFWYVELGAGRGTLGLALVTAFPSAQVTLIERSGVRYKSDHAMRNRSASFMRARIDIRDLDIFGGSCGGDGRPAVGIAKHLCGVATDLALRALANL